MKMNLRKMSMDELREALRKIESVIPIASHKTRRLIREEIGSRKMEEARLQVAKSLADDGIIDPEVWENHPFD
tara:strand:- start:10 stop:228 length:219 start_codon:yes stop_codon:yes gene_type:complete